MCEAHGGSVHGRPAGLRGGGHQVAAAPPLVLDERRWANRPAPHSRGVARAARGVRPLRAAPSFPRGLVARLPAAAWLSGRWCASRPRSPRRSELPSLSVSALSKSMKSALTYSCEREPAVALAVGRLERLRARFLQFLDEKISLPALVTEVEALDRGLVELLPVDLPVAVLVGAREALLEGDRCWADAGTGRPASVRRERRAPDRPPGRAATTPRDRRCPVR